MLFGLFGGSSKITDGFQQGAEPPQYGYPSLNRCNIKYESYTPEDL